MLVRYSALDYDIVHRRLAKHLASGAEGRVGWPASTDAIAQSEKRLGVSFPSAIRDMYLSFDGLKIEHPAFAIYPLDGVRRDAELLVFAVCDHVHELAFDTREVNEAGQWFIVNKGTGYRVTFTVASLLATRMWAWVQQRRPIWYDFFGDRAAE